jgi:hypothetical protein
MPHYVLVNMLYEFFAVTSGHLEVFPMQVGQAAAEAVHWGKQCRKQCAEALRESSDTAQPWRCSHRSRN